MQHLFIKITEKCDMQNTFPVHNIILYISFAVVIAELVVLKAHPQQSAASIASTRHHPLEVHVTLH
jgi:hypothetical protein